MGSFYLRDHQGKGRRYADAMTAAGYRRAEHDSDPELVAAFFDHDLGPQGLTTRDGLDGLHARGIPVFMYPHAARPALQWDGMYPAWPHTRASIVPADGHRQVLEAYGYPIPVEVVGWQMCEILPWQPVAVEGRPVNVVYAPIHPNHNGFLHPVDKAANAWIFHQLLRTPEIKLTVRHIFRLDLSGIWNVPGVKYVLANPNGKTPEIDQADCVVAHQTYAYLAAARGKPLVMFGDDLTPHSGSDFAVMRWVEHQGAYRDLLRYPVEAESARDGKQMRALIDKVMAKDVGKSWRKKFIGQPMDDQKFVKTIEKYF